MVTYTSAWRVRHNAGGRHAHKLISRDIDVCRAITQPDRERFFAAVKCDDD